MQSIVAATNTRPPKRGRRRAPATVLDAEDIERIDEQVKRTHKKARAETTLGVYSSYWRGITEWFRINKSDWCTDDIPPEVNCDLIRELCKEPQGLKDSATVFKRFLQSRKHISDKDDDGSAAIARVGTLSGYRSA